jgi:acetyl esterase/lipase
VVFVVNYRLVQDWPLEPGFPIYPAGRDAKAALHWVHANAAQYQVSTVHITAFGGSAGGLLSLMPGKSDGFD